MTDSKSYSVPSSVAFAGLPAAVSSPKNRKSGIDRNHIFISLPYHAAQAEGTTALEQTRMLAG
jgi:hypothetical protein